MADPHAPLSDREREVLQLLVTGATNLQIARRLVISPNTVKVHLRNIYDKMGVQSRTEASMVAVREGWVDVQAPEQPAPVPDTQSEPAPVAMWQRVYLVASLILVLAAALLPTLMADRQGTAKTDDFNDLPVVAELGAMDLPAEQWRQGASIPTARSRYALVALNDRLYAIAGATASGITGNVEIYDPASNGWLPGAMKPTAVSNVAGAALDGLIFVPGGYTAAGEVLDILEVYDPQRDAWSAAARMPGPLCGYAIAETEGALYLIGGWDGEQYVATVYVYHPGEGLWTEASSLSQPRGFAAAATVDGKILVVGGWDGQRELDLVEVFDAAAYLQGKPAWSGRAGLGVARGGLGLATVGSEVYAIGGGWRRWMEYNERYDPSTNTWSSIPTPLAGQWRNLGVAVLGGRIFAVGGWSHGHLALNEEYRTLYYRIHFPLGEKGQAKQ